MGCFGNAIDQRDDILMLNNVNLFWKIDVVIVNRNDFLIVNSSHVPLIL